MLRSFHDGFSWVVVVANAAVGVWALAAHWEERLRHRALWWATAAAQIAIFVQVGAGVALLSTEDIELDQFHTFYGFVALATVGIIYSYRAQLKPHLYLLYGFGGLFLMGLALRSMQFSPG